MGRRITLPKIDPDPPQVPLVREKIVSASLYKSLTADELKGLFAGVNFPTPPMTHQLASLAWALDGRDRCMLWLDIGLGKTLTSLYLAKLWGCKKVFVVCPNAVIWTWIDQVQEHCPPAPREEDTQVPGYQSWLFHSYPLVGNTVDRRLTYDHFLGLDIPAVGIINYEGLRYLFGIGKNMEQERTLNLGEAGVDCLILDEVHHCQHPTSLQTQILEVASDSVPHVIGLTGSAIERNVVDLWAQYRIVDGGMTLGPSHRTFLNLWCDQVGDRWYPKASATDKILTLVEPRTLRYSKAECVDLPPIIYEPVYLPLSAAQQDEIDCAAEAVRNLRQAEALGMQYQKICGGISLCKLEDGDTEPFFDELPKIEALFELLDVLGNKVVVYHFFVEEGRLLERECKKRGVTYSALRGEVKDKKGAIQSFCENPSIRLLIANSDCGSEGLNLQKATSQIVNYSRNWRQITRTQTEGRIHRVGQTKTCVVIDLLHRGTIDEVIYNCVKNKQDAAEEILKWMQQGQRV